MEIKKIRRFPFEEKSQKRKGFMLIQPKKPVRNMLKKP